MAAAFDVPSLIVTWRSLLDRLRFPVSGQGVVAAFLYPQHWHVAAEDLMPGHFREARLAGLLAEMAIRGKNGRATPMGAHRLSPCGFKPGAPRRVVRDGTRLRLLPASGAGPRAMG